MFDKFFDALGDSLFFLRDRLSKIMPRRTSGTSAAAPRISLSDRLAKIDWSIWRDPKKLVAASKRHQRVLLAVGCLVLIAVMLPVLARFMRSAPPPQLQLAYFYDLNGAQLFTGELSLVAPVEGPSRRPDPDGNPPGVRAHIFACGECNRPTVAQIAYLERYNPEAKAKLDEALRRFNRPANQLSVAARRELGITADMAGPEIALPGDTIEWWPIDTPEAEAILEAVRPVCDEGVAVVVCRP